MTPDEFNQECINQLKAADLKGRVAIIGSGPSYGFTQNIEELKQELCASCGITEIEDEHFWDLAERAYKRDSSQYFSVLEEGFLIRPGDSSPTYDLIARLPCSSFVTLNYDSLFPSAFHTYHEPRNEYEFRCYLKNAGDLPVAPQMISSKKWLIALHGYRSEKPDWHKNIILKLSDYNDAYTSPNAPLRSWWANLLLTTPCIFIGISLYEPGLHQVIERLMAESKDSLLAMDHIHLLNSPPAINGSYQAPGTSIRAIRQVYFDPKDNFQGLREVLAPFDTRNMPQLTIPTAQPIAENANFTFRS